MAAFVPIPDGQLSNSSALKQIGNLLSGNLNADVSLAGALAVTGGVTLSGALSVTGAAITVGAAGITSASPLLLTGTGSVKIVGGKLYPASDAGTAQTAAGIYAGTGVPSDANGANGDFYLRGDGTAAGKTTLYHKEGGTWAAIVP